MTKRIILVAALLVLSAAGRVSAQTDCEAARCAVQEAVNQNCPCSDPRFTNHGRYVSCVARTINQLAKNGTLPKNCKGKVKRCAARSSCGKAGFVACTIQQSGTCDTNTGMCTNGTLATGLAACSSDANCITASRCSIKRAETCAQLGGISGSGTCCAGCGAP